MSEEIWQKLPFIYCSLIIPGSSQTSNIYVIYNNYELEFFSNFINIGLIEKEVK